MRSPDSNFQNLARLALAGFTTSYLAGSEVRFGIKLLHLHIIFSILYAPCIMGMMCCSCSAGSNAWRPQQVRSDVQVRSSSSPAGVASTSAAPSSGLPRVPRPPSAARFHGRPSCWRHTTRRETGHFSAVGDGSGSARTRRRRTGQRLVLAGRILSV